MVRIPCICHPFLPQRLLGIQTQKKRVRETGAYKSRPCSRIAGPASGLSCPSSTRSSHHQWFCCQLTPALSPEVSASRLWRIGTGSRRPGRRRPSTFFVSGNSRDLAKTPPVTVTFAHGCAYGSSCPQVRAYMDLYNNYYQHGRTPLSKPLRMLVSNSLPRGFRVFLSCGQRHRRRERGGNGTSIFAGPSTSVCSFSKTSKYFFSIGDRVRQHNIHEVLFFSPSAS